MSPANWYRIEDVSINSASEEALRRLRPDAGAANYVVSINSASEEALRLDGILATIRGNRVVSINSASEEALRLKGNGNSMSRGDWFPLIPLPKKR